MGDRNWIRAYWKNTCSGQIIIPILGQTLQYNDMMIGKGILIILLHSFPTLPYHIIQEMLLGKINNFNAVPLFIGKHRPPKSPW